MPKFKHPTAFRYDPFKHPTAFRYDPFLAVLIVEWLGWGCKRSLTEGVFDPDLCLLHP